jgi:hypothetical protein
MNINMYKFKITGDVLRAKCTSPEVYFPPSFTYMVSKQCIGKAVEGKLTVD